MPTTDHDTTPFERTAELYDAVYAARGKDYHAEAERIDRSIRAHRRSAGNRLLDVACGTGEHLRHLRDRYEVTGVDASEAMLAVARRKLPGVDLLAGDMTTFDLGRRFDAVTCLFASIAYLPDEPTMRRAVQNMADHLAPGGVLLVEPGVTPDRLEPAREQRTSFDLHGVRITRTTTAVHASDSLLITFRYDRERGGDVETTVERHVVRLFSAQAYLDAFEDAGLATGLDTAGFVGTPLG